jgi:hypothetical protein
MSKRNAARIGARPLFIVRENKPRRNRSTTRKQARRNRSTAKKTSALQQLAANRKRLQRPDALGVGKRGRNGTLDNCSPNLKRRGKKKRSRPRP